ncbi:MAG: hypothetical protein LM581_00520 [Desulfurococcales archaeon]|nr:hypothetical protein [Desulfurococcales archaeon]
MNILNKYLEALGLLSLMLLILSIIPVEILSAKGLNENTSVDTQIINKDLLSSSRDVVHIILPVSVLKDLHGIRFDSLIASSCDDNNTLIIPKLVPRKFFRTFLSPINATILMPDVDDGILNENDLLILTVPIPRSGSGKDFSSCPWNVYAVKHGLRDRYVIKLSQGAKIFTETGVKILPFTVGVAIYYDHDHNRKPHLRDLPFDMELLAKISDVLNIERPKTHIVFPNFAGEAEKAEIFWNTWLNTIRERLISLRLSDNIIVSHEHREGFIYDPTNDRVVAEILDKEAEKKISEEFRNIYPTAELIDGGGGPSRFYEFVLITLNKTILTGSRSVNIYLGYNIYSSVVFIRANSTSSSNSYLRVQINVIDTDTGQIVWSNSYTYTLSSTPSNIYLYPSIPFDITRRFNISITYYYAGGSYPYVILSTLRISKIWDNMPTSETSKAYQILSLGIAPLRNRFSGSPPSGCQRAKASDMLDPSKYGFFTLRQGIIMPSLISSLTIDSDVMNGLYYDSLYGSSPILYIDICVRNPSSTSYTGTISIKIDGATVASKTISVPPLPLFGYVGFTLLQWSNPLGGHGHLITIEHNFPSNSNIELYIDMLLEYQYAPEVWKETSYRTWATIHSPWLKIQLTQQDPLATLYKSGIVVDAWAFGYASRNPMLVKHQVSTAHGYKILEVYLAVNPSASTNPPGCDIKRVEGTSIDEYIGAVVTAWSIIATGIEIASLLGVTFPPVVSAGVAAAGMLITILYMARETLSVSITPDGYYVCSWSPGINVYKVVELQLSIPYSGIPQNIYIKVGANDLWYTRPITFKIPSWPYEQIDASISERYPGFYGRHPGEVIYG